MDTIAPADAVVAIMERDGRFLFVKRSDSVDGGRGYWCPVSGRVEAGETQQGALRREAMEEVGLQIEPEAKVAEALSVPDGRYRLHYWSVRIVAGEARIANHEATELRWLTLDELQRLTPTFEDDLRVCEHVARSRR